MKKIAVCVSFSLMLLASACSDSPETSKTGKVATTQESAATRRCAAECPLPLRCPAGRIARFARQAIHRRPGRDGQAAPGPRRRRLQSHPVLHRKGRAAGNQLRIAQALRRRAQQAPEDGRAQGARGHRAAAARSAVSCVAVRQGRPRGGCADSHTGTKESSRIQHADPGRRLRDRSDRSRCAGSCERR